MKTSIRAVLFVLAAALMASCASQDSRVGTPAPGNTAASKSTGQDGADDTAGRGLEVEALPAGDTDIEVFPQLGHTSDVNSAAFSPDGKLIAASDGTLKLWEVASGREIRTLRGNLGSAVFSPDEKLIAAGTSDGTVKLWDAESGREIRTLHGHSGWEKIVYSVAFSPDGKLIASGSRDKTVKLWDTASGREILTLSGHSGWVGSVAFSPDGKLIASGSRDGTVKLWETASGREIYTLSGHSDDVRSTFSAPAAFSPDGKLIAAGASDGTVKLWDAESGREILTLSGHSGWVMSVAFSPDGKLIASGSRDRAVKLWDAASGREIRTLGGHSSMGIVTSVTFSPDGKLIASSYYGQDRGVRLWDTESGREIRSLSKNVNNLKSVAFSQDGKLIASGSNDGTVRLWDAASGQGRRTLRINSNINGLETAFSPDGKLIASGSQDGTVKLWDAASGQEIRSLRGHLKSVGSVAFSPDGKLIASGSWDETVRLWDAVSGRDILTLRGHSGNVGSLAFSPGGKLIASGGSSDKTVKLWDTESGREIRTLRDSDSVDSVAFSPDGRRIIVSASGNILLSRMSVKVWDVETGGEIRTLSDIGWGGSATYSPDGRYIVSTGGRKETVKVWDAETGEEVRTLSGHTGGVYSATYSPDGQRIVSASQDGTVRLWNAATGKEIARLISFTGSDTQIASATRGLTVETETAAASIDGEWLAMTPEGYYQASPQGDRYINVRVGNTVSGIDAYRSVLYNPDVVQARLAGKPDPASRGAVTIQQAASFLPPTVTIRSPESNTATGSATTTLSVSITDQNQPIQNIKIMVNGRILGRQELSAVKGTGLEPQKASFTVTGNQKTVDFQLPLSLDPGPNRIEVVAFNGFSESRRYADLTWNAPAGQRPALPNLWILAVGVNSYADSSIRNLNYCVADAKSVVDSLKTQEGKRYGKVNSLLIADGEGLSPTAANIRGNLGFLEGAGPRDVALLFLAGHGVSGSAGAFFFLPADTRLNADSTVNPATAITGAELFAALDAPGNRLVFIDACQSGGVDNDRLVRYLMDTNAFVFASSRGNELSQERPEFGHGVFTYSILNAIKGATAARAEGNVSVLSLSGFVSTDVPRITDDRQHPSAYSLGFYDFPLAAAP